MVPNIAPYGGGLVADSPIGDSLRCRPTSTLESALSPIGDSLQCRPTSTLESALGAQNALKIFLDGAGLLVLFLDGAGLLVLFRMAAA